MTEIAGNYHDDVRALRVEVAQLNAGLQGPEPLQDASSLQREQLELKKREQSLKELKTLGRWLGI
ncbi:MAG: hypothetical protein LC624_03975 [Halobacteriales archaeon]|nr:hypothetical protein [Halobacteriales archaeon]